MASLPFPTTPIFPPSPTKSKPRLQFPATHLPKPLQISQSLHTPLKDLSFPHISSLCKDGSLQEAFDALVEIELAGFQIGPEIYAEVLQGCVYQRAISEGRQIHARIVKNGASFAKNTYLETKLVIFYARCNLVGISLELFDRQLVRNVFSWAAVIGLCSRAGLDSKALSGFVEMLAGGFVPDNFVIPNALKSCSALQMVEFGRGIHGFAIKMGHGSCLFVLSSLVDFYGKCGVLEDARKLFDEMPERNVVAWNSMIVGYVQNGFDEEAVGIFHNAIAEGVQPTRVTIAGFLSASVNLDAYMEGRQGHAIAILNGLELDNILGSSIMNFYIKIGLVEDAELVFDQMVDKDIVTWNLLLYGYALNGHTEKAFATCREMRNKNLRFDSVTFSSILEVCANSGNVELGKISHGYCLRNHLETDLAVVSGLVDFYSKCTTMSYARRVFDATTSKDLVLWNTLISAYAQCGMSGEALKLFYQMQLEGAAPSVASWNSVIFGFIKNRQVNEAYDMFLQMQSLGQQPNVITWTTLISGFSKNGCGHEAIMLFEQMLAANIPPNASRVLGSCADVPSLNHGKGVHGYITRRQLSICPAIATALVDMYAKCGSLDLARKVFEMVPYKELPLYNAVITGFSMNGRANEAIELLKRMENDGLKPDEITVTGLLSACAHAGLADDALYIFENMVSKYGINPRLEHYDCMITLLARIGNLDEALKIMSSMPFAPDARIYGSLIAACREHDEIHFVEHLSKTVFKLEPENFGNYIALSNIYAAAGKWSDALKLRGLMKEKGLRKNPGCSWIQHENEQHTFVAGDRSHPQTDQIHEMLRRLEEEMRFADHGHESMIDWVECTKICQEIICS